VTELSVQCWPYRGYLNPDGYGNTHGVGTHRRVYEALIGPIPAGLQLDHLCRNRACYNPSHLEPVTQQENLRRGLTGKINHHNAGKTHCPHGHTYDEANTCNTRTQSGGPRRVCRACMREAARKRTA